MGVLSVKEMFIQMALQFVLKAVYEIILIPLVAPLIRKLKEYEGEDVYDRDISYGIFDIFRKQRTDA